MTPEEASGIWRECHSLLDSVTPLASDCGRLCDARCCAGGPEDGMLLFPGEESMYASPAHSLNAGMEKILPDTWHVKDSNILLPGRSEPIMLLVCDGKCDRSCRPVSCRIFPLLPWFDRKGRIRIRPDLRAAASCPLLFDDHAPVIRQEFAEAVCDAFLLADQIPGVRDLLDLLNEETALLRKFHGLEP